MAADAAAAMERRREEFFQRFPRARRLDAALQAPSNPTPLFFLAETNHHPDLKRVGFALGRLGKDIERQYLINGEVAFFFAPWSDFQRRSFNVFTNGLDAFSSKVLEDAGQGGRFTPSNKVVILVSSDAQAVDKIAEWHQSSSSGTHVVCVSPTSDQPESWRREVHAQLRSVLGERDLYRTQKPVTGEDFFGRGSILKKASAALAKDENVAILGLRRSGKTSVLRELKRRALSDKTIVTMADFENLASQSPDEFARSIATALIDDLRLAREAGFKVRIGDEREQDSSTVTLGSLPDRIGRVVRRNSEFRFVFALDEIEHLGVRVKQSPSDVRDILAALRSMANLNDAVVLAFAGVATRLFDSAILGGSLDNPMFRQVTPIYLEPFRLEDTTKLLSDLGRPMFLTWTDDAVARVHDLTGGLPYFVRNLASAVRGSLAERSLMERFEQQIVTVKDVDAVSPVWRESAGGDWRNLIDALALHYPQAAELLEPAFSPRELVQWIESDDEIRDAAEVIKRLGYLERVGPSGWRPTDALVSIHQMIGARGSRRGVGAGTDSPDALLALIRSGESENLEFKETFRINVRAGGGARQKDRV